MGTLETKISKPSAEFRISKGLHMNKSVSEANRFVSEVSKPPAGARIFKGRLYGPEILVFIQYTTKKLLLLKISDLFICAPSEG